MRIRIARGRANRVAVGRNIAAVMTLVIANGLAVFIFAKVNLADGLVVVCAAFIALDVFELVQELQDIKFEFIEAAGFEVLAAGIEILTVFALIDIDLIPQVWESLMAALSPDVEIHVMDFERQEVVAGPC